ncbi:MAG TPA: hypothetical protein VHP57_05180 [Acidimicrobiia bacterium]|nr:hypothetical protein [Acidimicrobiia bacterium]
MSVTAGDRAAAFGYDDDRVHEPESIGASLRRRFDGRFPIDPFGADGQLIDFCAPFAGAVVRTDVVYPERIPRTGAALLIANRGLGIVEPAAITVAIRKIVGRRARVVGAPSLPVIGSVVTKLGAIASRADDVAAALRAGYLVVAPLTPTWLRIGAGEAPRALFGASAGFPVIPVAVSPVGPLGLPVRPWRVAFGEPIELAPGLGAAEPVGAAELGELTREAVEALLG